MDFLNHINIFEALISVVVSFGVYVLRDFKSSMKDFNQSMHDMRDSVSQLNITMAVIIEKDETRHYDIKECKEMIKENSERIHDIEKKLLLLLNKPSNGGFDGISG